MNKALTVTLLLLGSAASRDAVTAPSVTAPSVTAPSVTAPSVTAPSVTAPSVTAPSVTAPSVTAPSATAADEDSPSPQAVSASRDPAARGLDLFVHAPGGAVAGGRLSLSVQAIGFPTVTAPRPLPGATIVASWDPESLPEGVRQHVAPATVQSDHQGFAHIDVSVPAGQGGAKLLLSVRHGAHERVRSIPVHITPPLAVQLYVSDQKVVPGSTVSAWALARRSDTGMPAAGTEVEFALHEGSYVRERLRMRTNGTGVATARIGIPKIELPDFEWRLSVRPTAPQLAGETASTNLSIRDETPGEPKLKVNWESEGVEPGKDAAFIVRVRDGSDEPMADLAIRYRIDAKKKATLSSATDDDWQATSLAAVTDGAGTFRGLAPMPSVVSPRGLPMHLEVRTTVLGHELHASSEFVLRSKRAPGGEIARKKIDITITPEASVIVPGIEQRLVLQATAEGRPVEGEFAVEGDGLSTRVRTNAFGYADITWAAPKTLGGHKADGDCADGVAAEIRVRPLDQPGKIERVCVSVDRDASLLVQVRRPVVVSGQPVSVHIAGNVHRAISVLAKSHDAQRSVSQWVAPGSHDVDLVLPAEAKGLWTISAAVPGDKQAARHAPSAAVLVVPQRLPRLSVSQPAGRMVPGGTVTIDARITDGKQAPMPGTVSVLVVDANGGRDPLSLQRLDTRAALSAGLVGEEHRDALLESQDPAVEPLRRAALGPHAAEAVKPILDPGANVVSDLEKAFESVVQALEGAIRDGTKSPENLDDIRRRGPHGWELNPEIEVAIRDTLAEETATPGGEPFTLADVREIDPQANFDHAARRVTRHKLLEVLTKVREYIHEHKLSQDEPVLRDPNAILRALVRNGALEDSDLLDPWGGTFLFVPDKGPRIPFLSLIAGYQLHAPGPDRKIGTPDDVRDPFARVLRSGTPYAKAAHEDEIVEAKWEMEVSDSTIESWNNLFQQWTGQSLSGEGIGLGGIGTLGHGTGSGAGSGHGRLGGSHRTTSELSPYTHWLAPVRTDAEGRVRLSIPLGPIETTWEVWLVAMPDGGLPAVRSVAIPAGLPISARVDAGGTWTEGDAGNVVVTLRNRTDKPADVVVTAQAQSHLVLKDSSQSVRRLTIPPGSMRPVSFAVRATDAGQAALAISVRAPGMAGDAVVHDWPVRPAGERVEITNAIWLASRSRLSLPLEATVRPAGPLRLSLEQGFGAVASAALHSMDPDRASGPLALADTAEVAYRIHRFFIQEAGQQHPTALVAEDTLARVSARLEGLRVAKSEDRGVERAIESALPWLPEAGRQKFGRQKSGTQKFGTQKFGAQEDVCPKEDPSSLHDRALMLDRAPFANDGSILACWDAFAATTLQQLQAANDPATLAISVLALVERPERQAETTALVKRLRELCAVRPTGEVVLPPDQHDDRAVRSVVLAALLRTATLVPGLAVPPIRLASWLSVQRDAGGGFGSSEATRFAIRALLPLAQSEKRTSAHIRVTAEGKGLAEAPTNLEVDAALQTLTLDPRAAAVQLETDTPGVVARLQQVVIRTWANPPHVATSPLHLEVTWPDKARASSNGTLRISLQHDLNRTLRVHTRIPLPPGVRISERVEGARQANGTIWVVSEVAASSAPTIVNIPIRYALPGQFTAPEVIAHAEDEGIRAYAPARPWVVTE